MWKVGGSIPVILGLLCMGCNPSDPEGNRKDCEFKCALECGSSCQPGDCEESSCSRQGVDESFEEVWECDRGSFVCRGGTGGTGASSGTGGSGGTAAAGGSGGIGGSGGSAGDLLGYISPDLTPYAAESPAPPRYMLGMKTSLVLEVASPNTMRITSYSLTGDCSQGVQSFCDALELESGEQVPDSQAVIELPDLAIGSYRIDYSADITTESEEPLPTGSGEVSFDVVETSHLSLGECSYILFPHALHSVEILNAMEDPVAEQRWYLFLYVFPGIWEDISNTLLDPADHPPMTVGFRPLEDHQLILVGNDPGPVQAAKVIVADSCTILP